MLSSTMYCGVLPGWLTAGIGRDCRRVSLSRQPQGGKRLGARARSPDRHPRHAWRPRTWRPPKSSLTAIDALDSRALVVAQVLRSNMAGATPRLRLPCLLAAAVARVDVNDRNVPRKTAVQADLQRVTGAVHEIVQRTHPPRGHRRERYRRLAVTQRRRGQKATDAAVSGMQLVADPRRLVALLRLVPTSQARPQEGRRSSPATPSATGARRSASPSPAPRPCADGHACASAPPPLASATASRAPLSPSNPARYGKPVSPHDPRKSAPMRHRLSGSVPPFRRYLSGALEPDSWRWIRILSGHLDGDAAREPSMTPL